MGKFGELARSSLAGGLSLSSLRVSQPQVANAIVATGLCHRLTTDLHAVRKALFTWFVRTPFQQLKAKRNVWTPKTQ